MTSKWAWLALLLPTCAAAQDSGGGPYFYRPLDYGSASTLTPATIFLNRGFSIIQMSDDYPRDPRELEWGVGADRVLRTLAHPLEAVEVAGGWGRVSDIHLNPFGGVPFERAGWFPNFFGHLLAGGQAYRYQAEWLAAHGAPYPRTTSALAYMATQFVNEVIEAQKGGDLSAGTALDLYLFDPASILLFEVDAVARFFGQRLNALDWSPMPALTIPNGEVQNNGQVIAYKLSVPFVDRLDAVAVIGITGQGGLMLDVGEGNHVGAGWGIAAIDRELDPVTGEESATLTPSYGFYWDRNHSLLASVGYNPDAKNTLAINVYPGAIPRIGGSLGFWLVHTREGRVRFGVASARVLGLGLGFGAG